MAIVEYGTIEDGRLILDQPLDLPNGTKVVVSIQPEQPLAKPKRRKPVDFSKLPSFGMWANREDMKDSAAWVRGVREQWQQRIDRTD